MKLIINAQCLQIVVYWVSLKAILTALTSLLKLVGPFVTILLTVLAAPEIHRLLSLLGM